MRDCMVDSQALLAVIVRSFLSSPSRSVYHTARSWGFQTVDPSLTSDFRVELVRYNLQYIRQVTAGPALRAIYSPGFETFAGVDG